MSEKTVLSDGSSKGCPCSLQVLVCRSAGAWCNGSGPHSGTRLHVALRRAAAHREPVCRVWDRHLPRAGLVPPLRVDGDGAARAVATRASVGVDDPGVSAAVAPVRWTRGRRLRALRRRLRRARERGAGRGAPYGDERPQDRHGDGARARPVPHRRAWQRGRDVRIPARRRNTGGEQMNVAIVGVGLHPFGRFADRTGIDMGAIAIRRALADADVTWRDIQFGFAGSYEIDNPDAVVALLGLTGIPFTNVYNGCATAASVLALAADTIRLGEHDLGIAVGMDKHLPGAFSSDPRLYACPSWYGELGQFLTPKFFGMKINKYMHDHGISAMTLARVAARRSHPGGDLPPDRGPRPPHRDAPPARPPTKPAPRGDDPRLTHAEPSAPPVPVRPPRPRCCCRRPLPRRPAAPLHRQADP